jgi:diguanylate cyclase (GGDEF)-like protein
MSPGRRSVVPHVVDAVGLTALLLAAVSVIGALQNRATLVLPPSLASSTLFAVGHLLARHHQERLQEQLADAHRDPLTGLPTRATARDVLASATGGRVRLTVALVDVDGLRAVNNRLGHAAGDQYLTTVAARLRQATPAGGQVARLGGDELIVLCPDADPTELAIALDAALAGPAPIAGRLTRPSASIGIATSDGGDAHHALARADAAMYSAKAAGGAHALVFDAGRDGEPAPDGTRRPVRRRDLGTSLADSTAA